MRRMAQRFTSDEGFRVTELQSYRVAELQSRNVRPESEYENESEHDYDHHTTTMPTPVLMPQMGESIAEGTIVRWIKKVGEKVDRDEPLFEISTDKVDAEIPSPVAGVLSAIAVREGETVPVNSVVATIGDADSVVVNDRSPSGRGHR